MKYLFLLSFLLHASLCHSQFSDLKPITTTADGVRWIDSADIDGDGFYDILAANRFGSNITWYKNVNAGATFIAHEIAFLNQTSMVTAGDLDGDGDQDIIASTTPDHLIVWFENLDGLGGFSSQKIVDNNTINAFFLLIEDIDVDGDLDILSSGDGGKIEWYENTDGLGSYSPAIIIDNAASSRSTAMEDLDNDGDLDLVADSTGAINVWWYENLDGFGNFGARQEVGGTGLAASRIQLTDFDDDGFIDVLAVYVAADRIVWYKNLAGTGNFSSEINISLSDKASGVSAVDIDNDDDIDILASSPLNPFLKWYENLDGLGNFSTPRIIESEFVGSRCLALDIDNDGDLDAVRSSQNDDTIVWYENLLILSTAEAQLKTIKVHPNPADTALYITGTNTGEINYMRISNILGITIWEAQEFKNTVNSASWSSGSYFLELKNNSGQNRVIQIIKK